MGKATKPAVKNAPYPDVNDEKASIIEDADRKETQEAIDSADSRQETTAETEPTEEPRPRRAYIDFEAPGEFIPTPESEGCTR